MSETRAPKGTYRNPANKHCFVQCSSCYRCENKTSRAACGSCSGRPDKEGTRVPIADDYCRCNEGIMQWITKDGKLIQRRYLTSPFKASVTTDAETEDERDWNSYIRETRELLDNEKWDPVQFNDNSSTHDWTRRNRGR